MKKPAKSIIVIIFIVSFCGGFVLAYKFLTAFIEKRSTQSVENNNSDYEVLIFTPNQVDIVKLGDVENFKRQNPEFSFIVPRGKEEYINQKLNSEIKNKNEGLIFSLEVKQLTDNRQLIIFSSDDARSIVRNIYEASDNQVFPKTSMYVNFRYTIPKLIGSAIGGIITCLFLFVIYKRMFAKDLKVLR